MTKIITEESIFKWLREILPFKPFICSRCMSVWVGISLSFFFPTIVLYISFFIYGMISYTSVRLLEAWLSTKEFTLDER